MARPIQEIGLGVKRLQMRHHRGANAALAPLGLSIVQWDALRHLDQNPSASLHDLARLTFQSDQAFGTLAARMIDRGLIERVPAPGRAIRHRLTEKGQKLRAAGGEVLDRILTDSFADLSADDLSTFGDILQRLLASSGRVSSPPDAGPK